MPSFEHSIILLLTFAMPVVTRSSASKKEAQLPQVEVVPGKPTSGTFLIFKSRPLCSIRPSLLPYLLVLDSGLLQGRTSPWPCRASRTSQPDEAIPCRQFAANIPHLLVQMPILERLGKQRKTRPGPKRQRPQTLRLRLRGRCSEKHTTR